MFISEMQLRESVEHKTRVLSTTNEDDQFKVENSIRQVTEGLHEGDLGGTLQKLESTREEGGQQRSTENNGTVSTSVAVEMVCFYFLRLASFLVFSK